MTSSGRGLRSGGDETEAPPARDGTERRGDAKKRHRWGEGGRLSENVPQICPVPSDEDPVVSVGVSKVCTKILVSIGYGAIIIGLLEVPAYLCCSKKKGTPTCLCLHVYVCCFC